ncbi:hypothetical protein [uncultured Polaribacter sp.]|uniref:hypothetical protein n=1 Tax=uncultured Polaribacter sp. TaxID=174711 RepID=UPI002611520F|nr:hypothetical protein [uncultured Polaribacter sp.]
MENEIKNSEDYLKSILKKETGFTTPENYFSKVEDNIETLIFKEKLPTKTGFKVPDAYFNTIQDTILDNIKIEKEVKVISLKQRILKYSAIGVAATIALFLSLNFFNTTATTADFNKLAQTDIENWIVENSSEFTTEDFATILNESILNEEEFVFTDLKNDAIEEYIINTDNTYLLNENY